MGKSYKITAEDSLILRQAMEQKENKRHYKRLLAVALRGEGKSNEEIGLIVGYHTKRVSQLVSLYANEGLSKLAMDGRKGGNNKHMDDAEANEFLNQFTDEAIKGQVVTIDDIAKAYDEAVGVQHKSLSSLYYFLHKHGWRKIMPKKQHPGKATEEVIEASKKLTLS